MSADKTATVAPRPTALLGPHLCRVRPASGAGVAYSHPMQLASVPRYAPKGQRDDLEALSAGPVPYFRGTPTLFCQRQNTGRTGLDDHYSPVS